MLKIPRDPSEHAIVERREINSKPTSAAKWQVALEGLNVSRPHQSTHTNHPLIPVQLSNSGFHFG